jgi:hypothetical protein
MDAFISDLHRKLCTPGLYTNNYLLQLVAWHLNKQITIHDVLDDHTISLDGKRPWTSHPAPTSTLGIAYRRHQQHWSYNADFTPRARLDGHYWGIVPLLSRPRQPLPTHNRFSVLTDDDTAMLDAPPSPPLGNARASVSPRH